MLLQLPTQFYSSPAVLPIKRASVFIYMKLEVFYTSFYKKQSYSSEIYSIWNNAQHGGTCVSPAADFRSIELLDPLTSTESIFIDAGEAEIRTEL